MSSGNSAPAAPNYTPITQGLSSLAAQEEGLGGAQNTNLTGLNAGDQAASNAAINSDQNISGSESQLGNSINNQYASTYQPLENQYANTAESYASPSNIATQMGQAEGTAAQTNTQALNNEQQQLESYGISPDSTRYQALTQQGDVQGGASEAAAGNAAYANTINTGLSLESNAIGQGEVMPSMAAGAGNVAEQGNIGAVDSGNATTQTNASTLGTDAGYLSLAGGAYGAEGDVLNQSYQNQIAQYNANTLNSEGIGQGLGMVASLGMNSLGANGAFGSFGALALAKGGTVPAVGGDDDDNNGPYKKPFHDHLFYVFHGRARDGSKIPLKHALWHFFTTGQHIGTFPSRRHAIAAMGVAPQQDYAGGGAVDATNGAYVSPALSPSAGAVTDDIPGVTNQGAAIKVNAGEFVVPKDVTGWKGKEFFQKLIDKSRKAEKESTAKPTLRAGAPAPMPRQLARPPVPASPVPMRPPSPVSAPAVQ